MSASKHYDVVVLGTGLGAIASAALLARRGWRVAVVGHGARPPTYAFDGMPLARRAFTFLGASSPTFTRILVELAQSQTFRRHLASLDPMFQVCLPGARLEVPPDTGLFQREIEREFPAARRVLSDLYTELARTNAAADEIFEADAVWPPGGFWERRETDKLAQGLPWAGDPDLLSELAHDHPYRAIVDATTRFASDQVDPIPTCSRARLHGAWTRGVQALAGGEEELTDFFFERLRAHGGELLLHERASRLAVKGNKVRGVHLVGEDEPLGVTFVVLDGGLAELAPLVPDQVRKLDEHAGLVEPGERRFVTSIVARREGLPRALGRELFLVGGRASPLHVQRTTLGDGLERLTVEALVADGADLRGARARVCEEVFGALPFLEDHVVLCDSPHDGLPLWDARDASRGGVEVAGGLRALLRDRTLARAFGASIEAEPMVPRYAVTEASLRGLAGEPLRAPVGNVFLAGRTSLPSLGQEGQLLAAWGVSRVITRTDRTKEKMLREMWSKVELS